MVLAHDLSNSIGEVVNGVIVGAAVDSNGAVFVVLGHSLGCSNVLIPGPAVQRQFAQTGFVPCVQIDGDVVAQTAGGEGIDGAILLESIGAPVLDQVDAVFFYQIGQVIEQTGFPTLVGVGQTEGCQNVNFTCQNGGIDRGVTIGVVAVGVQNDFNIGVDLIKSSDHGIHTLAALEGNVEVDSAGNSSGIFIDDPAGVQFFNVNALIILFGRIGGNNGVVSLGGISGCRVTCATGNHGQDHDQSQQQSDQLFHCVSSIFVLLSAENPLTYLIRTV